MRVHFVSKLGPSVSASQSLRTGLAGGPVWLRGAWAVFRHTTIIRRQSAGKRHRAASTHTNASQAALEAHPVVDEGERLVDVNLELAEVLDHQPLALHIEQLLELQVEAERCLALVPEVVEEEAAAAAVEAAGRGVVGGGGGGGGGGLEAASSARGHDARGARLRRRELELHLGDHPRGQRDGDDDAFLLQQLAGDLRQASRRAGV